MCGTGAEMDGPCAVARPAELCDGSSVPLYGNSQHVIDEEMCLIVAAKLSPACSPIVSSPHASRLLLEARFCQ